MTTDTTGDGNKDLEWEERTLCSDEACIGIIGPDGRCNECGKPYAGRPAGAADDGAPGDDLALEPEPFLDEDADDSADDFEEIGLEDDTEGNWEDRILCRDESCIGVIGPDGRCKECGLPLDGDED